MVIFSYIILGMNHPRRQWLTDPQFTQARSYHGQPRLDSSCRHYYDDVCRGSHPPILGSHPYTHLYFQHPLRYHGGNYNLSDIYSVGTEVPPSEDQHVQRFVPAETLRISFGCVPVDPMRKKIVYIPRVPVSFLVAFGQLQLFTIATHPRSI